MEHFRVVEHKIPCQHIREYPRATSRSQHDVLQLSVKQYLPLTNPSPQPGDVSIVAAHANGFCKELYEPLWDALFVQSKQQKWRIRSVWMADVANQGASYILNEDLLGNDPHWHDHSRDLLHLININRDEMPSPLVGIGHSIGGNQLAFLSLLHPRLLTSLILLDPIINESHPEISPMGNGPPNVAQLSTFRRDIWKFREEAAAKLMESPAFRTWDHKVQQKFIKHGLRDTPTLLHPDARPPKVTLATPPAQEVFTFYRPNYDGYGTGGKPTNRQTHADVDPSQPTKPYPFYNPEPRVVYLRLGELRPSVLYIWGESSEIDNGATKEAKLATTGAGPGGSGGKAKGRVKGVTLDGVGHLFPMEAVDRTAAVMADWVGTESILWREWERNWQNTWKEKSPKEKQEIDDIWKSMMGGSPKRAKI